MKWPKKYKDYYDYYKNRVPFPASTGIFFIAICLIAYVVYTWLR